jgi:hypothetical protein
VVVVVVVVVVVTTFPLLYTHPPPNHHRTHPGAPHAHARVRVTLPSRHEELAFGRLDQHGVWKVAPAL